MARFIRDQREIKRLQLRATAPSDKMIYQRPNDIVGEYVRT